jgi:hypothetical protein
LPLGKLMRSPEGHHKQRCGVGSPHMGPYPHPDGITTQGKGPRGQKVGKPRVDLMGGMVKCQKATRPPHEQFFLRKALTFPPRWRYMQCTHQTCMGGMRDSGQTSVSSPLQVPPQHRPRGSHC